MAYEPKPGEISLFPATDEDKQRVSQDLVLTGNGKDLSGADCWASVFTATRKDGSPVKTKDGKQVYNVRLKAKTGGSGVAAARAAADEGEMPPHSIDDDIPF